MNAAEQMATRLMCDCFEKKLVTSSGVITCLEVLRHAISKALSRIERGDVAGAVSVLNNAFCWATVKSSGQEAKP